ncbi:5-formyltetrahydrofolate cyclo-ligase [Roseomonas sp. BN140053]|uniref:5-formyltetrahydrofolate cyclo-ligase n=1 Tax=Roseomonas sp. BN140053 TaxID=3391898 RepID=UPI0039EAD092
MAAPHPFPDGTASGRTAAPPDLVAAKAELRRAMLARRAGLDGTGAGDAVAHHVLTGLAPPRDAVVAAYWPRGDELDPRSLLTALAARGQVLALPVTTARGQPLLFRRWQPGEEPPPGRYGLREPPPGAPELRPDWLFVPLLAFDRRGHRLGYGAGYYDRTLESLPGAVAIGLALAEQERPEVPAGPGDVPLRAVVTPAGIIHCGAVD